MASRTWEIMARRWTSRARIPIGIWRKVRRAEGAPIVPGISNSENSGRKAVRGVQFGPEDVLYAPEHHEELDEDVVEFPEGCDNVAC